MPHQEPLQPPKTAISQTIYLLKKTKCLFSPAQTSGANRMKTPKLQPGRVRVCLEKPADAQSMWRFVKPRCAHVRLQTDAGLMVTISSPVSIIGAGRNMAWRQSSTKRTCLTHERVQDKSNTTTTNRATPVKEGRRILEWQFPMNAPVCDCVRGGHLIPAP